MTEPLGLLPEPPKEDEKEQALFEAKKLVVSCLGVGRTEEIARQSGARLDNYGVLRGARLDCSFDGENFHLSFVAPLEGGRRTSGRRQEIVIDLPSDVSEEALRRLYDEYRDVYVRLTNRAFADYHREVDRMEAGQVGEISIATQQSPGLPIGLGPFAVPMEVPSEELKEIEQREDEMRYRLFLRLVEASPDKRIRIYHQIRFSGDKLDITGEFSEIHDEFVVEKSADGSLKLTCMVELNSKTGYLEDVPLETRTAYDELRSRYVELEDDDEEERRELNSRLRELHQGRPLERRMITTFPVHAFIGPDGSISFDEESFDLAVAAYKNLSTSSSGLDEERFRERLKDRWILYPIGTTYSRPPKDLLLGKEELEISDLLGAQYNETYQIIVEDLTDDGCQKWLSDCTREELVHP